MTCPFGSVEDAKSGLTEWFRLANHPPHSDEYRIVDSHGEEHAWLIRGSWSQQVQYTQQHTRPAGGKGASKQMGTISLPIHLQKPLNLDREKVVAKLKENLANEKAKREAAEKKESDARNAFRQFVLDHEEQIVNYLRSSLAGSSSSWTNSLERAEEVFKDDAFKSPDSKPGRLESELEKFVRVLEMTAEATIEVEPTQQVYDLL